jgi:V/A-type H+-transporting ATPase subunit I
MPPAADGALVRILSQDDNHRWGVQIAGAPLSPAPGLTVAPLPERSLSTLRARRLAACRRHAAVNRILAAMAPGIDALLREQALRGEDYDSATVQAAMGAGENVVWLTGYTPDERLASLRDAARRHGWGLLARKPRPDEEPPTLLRPPRIFRPIAALFSLLGIVPGYREADISIVFYAFFTLFFAMLVGDAGYGVLLLLGTLWARRKWRQAPAAPLTLSTVFAVATIGWGILTATYFGIPATALPALLNHRLSRWLADQSNIMQLCFALGAVHLSIARLWNAIVFYPSRKALAQLGWLGIIWNMYCVACLVVVPGFVYPPVMFWLAGLSVLLIAGFMLDRSELKTQGVELAMLPLTIIGSLGDVISYVRLFAVGMAGVKVAENFNGMALGLPLPLWLKIPAMLLILLLGHGLNLAMGGLSILVHAVRLNTLEFSTHKGITWAGFAYRPFKRRLAADAPAEA